MSGLVCACSDGSMKCEVLLLSSLVGGVASVTSLSRGVPTPWRSSISVGVVACGLPSCLLIAISVPLPSSIHAELFPFLHVPAMDFFHIYSTVAN